MEFTVNTPAEATGNKRRACNKTLAADTFNGVDCELFISPCHSFDGTRWHIHGDKVFLRLDEIQERDEQTGMWEPNPDCCDEGSAWAELTPEQAIALARKLLRMANACRRADEVDLTDPELIKSCRDTEQYLKKQWEGEENSEAEPLLPPQLEKSWMKK